MLNTFIVIVFNLMSYVLSKQLCKIYKILNTNYFIPSNKKHFKLDRLQLSISKVYAFKLNTS